MSSAQTVTTPWRHRDDPVTGQFPETRNVDKSNKEIAL